MQCLLFGHDQISYWNKPHIHGLQLKSYDLCEINEAETFLSKLPSYLLAESHNSIELNVIVWIETTFSFRLLMITSTSNPFLCAADFFSQLGSCKEAVR